MSYQSGILRSDNYTSPRPPRKVLSNDTKRLNLLMNFLNENGWGPGSTEKWTRRRLDALAKKYENTGRD